MATMYPVLFDFKFVEGSVLLGFNGLLSETELQKVKGDHPEKPHNGDHDYHEKRRKRTQIVSLFGWR